MVIEYLGFYLLLFTTQFNKPLYLSKSDYLYELSITAEAFQRTGQQVFRTVTKNIETNPLDGYPRLDKVQQRHNETKVFMIAHLDFHITAFSHVSKEIKRNLFAKMTLAIENKTANCLTMRGSDLKADSRLINPQKRVKAVWHPSSKRICCFR